MPGGVKVSQFKGWCDGDPGSIPAPQDPLHICWVKTRTKYDPNTSLSTTNIPKGDAKSFYLKPQTHMRSTWNGISMMRTAAYKHQ